MKQLNSRAIKPCAADERDLSNHTMAVSHKDCFGKLDTVFPMGKVGLREVPANCFECSDKKACLQAALATKKGLTLKCEVLERAPSKGLMGRLRRWSEKKALTQLIKKKEEKRL